MPVAKGRRQDDGFFVLAIVGAAEIHRVQIDTLQQGLCHGGHPRLGVAHGGGIVAVDVAEITLAVHQGIALGELLGQADQGIVDRLVAVRVKLAHHVADDAGAFLEAGVRVQLQLPHGVQNAPVHRLHAIAHIGQGARHNGGKGIGEVAFAKGLTQGCIADVTAFENLCHALLYH